MVLFMDFFGESVLIAFFEKQYVMIAKSTNHYKFTNYVLKFGLFIKKLIIIEF